MSNNKNCGADENFPKWNENIICDYCEKPIQGRIYDHYWPGWTPRICERCYEDPISDSIREKYKQKKAERFKEWITQK